MQVRSCLQSPAKLVITSLVTFSTVTQEAKGYLFAELATESSLFKLEEYPLTSSQLHTVTVERGLNNLGVLFYQVDHRTIS